MLDALLTAYTLLEMGTCMVIWIPLLGVVRLRHRQDPAQRVAGRWLRRFARTSTNLSPLWRISIDGQVPNDISHRAYVVVANHQSNLDPFLLSHLPWDMRWIAKQELFKIPVIGSLLRLSGDIPLRRGNSESVHQMAAQCRETLDRGLSVMMFPEGTRTRDGSLGAFKDGAFRIAIEAQVPVLPIAIEGTRDGLPAGGWRLQKVRARARILEPVPTVGLGAADIEPLRDTVRTRIANAF